MILCPSCQARNADQALRCVRCGGALNPTRDDRDPGGETDSLPVVVEEVPARLVDQAAEQLAEGQASGAISSCRRALALSPGNVEAYALLGMALEQTQDLEGALEAYDTVLLLAPDRAAERQKASLLRLRLEGRAAYDPPPARVHDRWAWLRALTDRLGDNLPLVIGAGAALLVLIIGSFVLVHASRAKTREGQYQAFVSQADQSLADGRYAVAAQFYSQAWQLQPGDEALRQRWQQACDSDSAQRAGQPVELPKYVPSTGVNPFPPVPVTNGPQPLTGTAAEQLPLTVPAVPPSVPAPPAAANNSDTVSGQSRQQDSGIPSPTVKPRRPLPAGPSVKPGSNPLTTVPSRSNGQSGAPGKGDTTPLPPKSSGEVTIWTSAQRSGTAPTQPRASYSDAQGLRSHAEALERAGKTSEAINQYESAAGVFESSARGNPAAAAAASSCRARIEYLRARQ